MTLCDRCRKEIDATIMSIFNTDILCLDCQEAEQHDPGFETARQAEGEAVLQGDFNFPGIRTERLMTKRQAINFMISIAEDHDDGAEVSCTRLAEECAVEFDCADDGGPLDDETHPIWDWAVEAADNYDRYTRKSR